MIGMDKEWMFFYLYFFISKNTHTQKIKTGVFGGIILTSRDIKRLMPASPKKLRKKKKTEQLFLMAGKEQKTNFRKTK